MKKWLEAYYGWKLERRRKFFEKLLADKTSGVPQMVHNRSVEMAMQMVMHWLDNKRIRHCSVCPSTETLSGIGGRFFCPGHKDEAQRVFEEYQKSQTVQKVAVPA